mmetsp:Transcript_19997/g.55562  ORF Transcript_19997/g.55562 Transcript_19997/m.55562 type:complete len:274 (+) Transcript_19997:169-990(+)
MTVVRISTASGRGLLLFLLLAASDQASTTGLFGKRRHPHEDGPASLARSRHLPNVQENGVLMTPREQALVMGSLGSEKTMLEYGTGGSTKYYSRFVRQYYTIEHNQRFFEMMKPDLDALPNVVAHLEPVEKGYNGWTGGMNAGNYEQFHNYVHAIDKLGVKHFDVVLVDGRARVACAVNALKYLHKDSVVLLHDFYGGEPGVVGGNYLGRRFSRQYIQVLLFYDEVERADSIVKLKPKPEMLQIARYVDIAHLYAWQVKGSPHGIDLKKWNEL